MNRDQSRKVEYQKQIAYFHQWIKKSQMGTNYQNQESYALIELEDGTLREVRYSEIKFRTLEAILNKIENSER